MLSSIDKCFETVSIIIPRACVSFLFSYMTDSFAECLPVSHLMIAVRPDPSSVTSPLRLLELDYGDTFPNPVPGDCDGRSAKAHNLCLDDDHIYGFLGTDVGC